MSALRREWYARGRGRRRLDDMGAALAPSLLGEAAPSPAVGMAIARSVIQTLVDRSVEVSFERGMSHAKMNSCSVVLDSSLLESKALAATGAESLVGVSIHEAGHLLLSPPSGLATDRLFRTIQNILEDERIEARMVRDDPRFIHPLHVARRDLLDPAKDDASFLHAFFTLLRCESEISPKLWKRHHWRLEQAIEILTPFPETFEEVREASLSIALLIPPNELNAPIFVTEYRWPGAVDPAQTEGTSQELIDYESVLVDQKPIRNGPSLGANGWPPVYWHEHSGCPEAYAQERAKLGAKPSLLADRLRTMLPVTRSPRQSTGRLDRKRLHAHQHSLRIFRAPTDRRHALSIALILDLSASMHGRSAALASQVATLLAEAARLLPDVDLEVFGHNADRNRRDASTAITRFPADAQQRVLGVATLPIDGNNRDAHAYRLIGEELNASPMRRSRHRIAILVADGLPRARGFSGQAARDQTRDAIVWLETSWGPVLFIATDEVPALRKMVPGESFRFRSGHAIDELSRNLTWTLRRSLGGAR